jgi:hypothetical protein
MGSMGQPQARRYKGSTLQLKAFWRNEIWFVETIDFMQKFVILRTETSGYINVPLEDVEIIVKEN